MFEGIDSYCFQITTNRDKHGQIIFEEYDDERYWIRSNYCDNVVEGLKKWYYFIREVFDLRFDNLHFCLDVFNDNNSITNWLSSVGQAISHVTTSGNNVKHSDVAHLLSSIKTIEWLSIGGEKEAVDIPKGLDFLQISDGKWMKLEQLLELEVNIMKLCSNSLSNQDLNKFLKKWIHGNSNNTLQSFEIEIQNGEAFDEIVEGIQHTKMDAERVSIIEDWQVLTNGPVGIIRNDGSHVVVYAYTAHLPWIRLAASILVPVGNEHLVNELL